MFDTANRNASRTANHFLGLLFDKKYDQKGKTFHTEKNFLRRNSQKFKALVNSVIFMKEWV